MRSFYTIASGIVTVYTHYLYDAAGQRVKKLTRKNDGTLIESTTYIDGLFEHHKKDSEEKNYIQIQGCIEKRIGYFDGDMAPPETPPALQMLNRLTPPPTKSRDRLVARPTLASDKG